MLRNAQRLLRDALQLPEEDRAELALGLLDSLEPAVPKRELDDEEWLAEIERRARAALAGEPGIPWAEARDIVEQRLKRG
ncbi:MAG TPA: addiction module protein [Thermoanaerobaculia bacterium]|nr:addiction module protein [Thermoanaerobaculia bacterium]